MSVENIMRAHAASLLALLLLFTAAPRATYSFARAPQEPAVAQSPESDEALLKRAEKELRMHGFRSYSARRAEILLKRLLEQYPHSPLRPQAEEMLYAAQEKAADQIMQIGLFYYQRFERGVAPNAMGALSRMRELTSNYPRFSRMDEALHLLAKAHLAEGEGDEAAAALKRLLREYPRSPFATSACELLKQMGYRWVAGCAC